MNEKILKPTDFFDKLQFIKNNPEPEKLDFTNGNYKLVPKNLAAALTKETVTKLGIKK